MPLCYRFNASTNWRPPQPKPPEDDWDNAPARISRGDRLLNRLCRLHPEHDVPGIDDIPDEDARVWRPLRHLLIQFKPNRPHGPRVEPAHKVQIAKRSTKKAGAKKVAKKKVAKAARGYKEHFAGSRKGKGHKWFDKIGAEQALPKIIALGVKPDTAKGWLRSWKREMRRRQIESVAG
jgi:hypothetical protein